MVNDRYGPNKEMKNGWLTFYTKIKPWFNILLGVMWIFLYNPINCIIQTCGIMNNILGVFGVEPINWINAGSERWANITAIVVCIVSNALPIIISILCPVLSGINYKKYVNIVKISLLVDLLIIVFLTTVYINDIIWFIIVLLVGYFTWYRLNVKYFEARIVDPDVKAKVI